MASFDERLARQAPGADSAALAGALPWVTAAILFVLLREAPHASQAFGGVLTAVLLHVLYGLVALLLLLPAVFEETAGGPVRANAALPCWPGLAWLTRSSPYHTIVIAQIDKLLVDHGVFPRYLIVVAVSLPLSLACAAASFYLVERPLMRLRRRGRRPRPLRA